MEYAAAFDALRTRFLAELKAWDPQKHPRRNDGRFGTGAGKPHVGATRLKTAGVGHGDLIKVLSSRVRKYAGHATVGDFVKAHPKGKAYALRALAADHKAGRIAFAGAKEPEKPKAPRKPPADGPKDVGGLGGAYISVSRDGAHVRAEHGGKVQAGDRIVGRTEKTRERYGNMSVGEFIANHPKGKDAALRTLAKDIGNGHVTFHRVESRPEGIAFGPGVSEAFVERVGRGWAAIPSAAKKLIAAKGITVHAPNTLVDVAPDLADKQPRGWAPGSTWKEVGGAFRGDRNQVIVGEQVLRPGGGLVSEHRSDSVMCHEMGHALDAAYGNASGSDGFRAAFRADLEHYARTGGDPKEQYRYFLQPENDHEGGRSEMFAEMFADRLGFPTNPRDPPLSKRFPACAKVIGNIIDGLRRLG